MPIVLHHLMEKCHHYLCVVRIEILVPERRDGINGIG